MDRTTKYIQLAAFGVLFAILGVLVYLSHDTMNTIRRQYQVAYDEIVTQKGTVSRAISQSFFLLHETTRPDRSVDDILFGMKSLVSHINSSLRIDTGALEAALAEGADSAKMFASLTGALSRYQAAAHDVRQTCRAIRGSVGSPGFRAALDRIGKPIEKFVKKAYEYDVELMRIEALFSRTIHNGIARSARMTFYILIGLTLLVAAALAVFLKHDRDLTAALRDLTDSEDRLRRVTDNIPGMVYQCRRAPDGAVSFPYVSPTFEAYFGYTPDEIMANGRRVVNAIHPADADRFRSEMIRSLKTLTSYNIEHRVVGKDGSRRWLHTQGVPRRLETGEVVWTGVSIDVTDRKRAEAEVREADARLRSALDAVSDGIWDWNVQTGKTVLSDRSAEIFGFDPSEPFPDSDTVFSRVHPDDLPTIEAALRDHVEGKTETYQHEFRVRSSEGQTRWVLGRGRVIEWDAEGQPLRLIGTNTDITDRKRAEEETERLQRRLIQAQKMEAVGILAGGIAHEINNALFIIIGNSELAEDVIPPGSPAAWNLKEIQAAGLRARDVVRQLLTFSRKGENNPQRIDITPVVKESLELIRSTIPANIEIIPEIEPGLDPVMADPSQIQQLLINLCKNAADAIGDKAGRISVRLAGEVIGPAEAEALEGVKPGRHVALTIQDTGVGMDEATRAQIFNPFFTTKAVDQGTGLGLSVVHGIVSQHNGTIVVDSAPGAGTSVTVRFPVGIEFRDLRGSQQRDLRGSQNLGGLPKTSEVSPKPRRSSKNLGALPKTSEVSPKPRGSSKNLGGLPKTSEVSLKPRSSLSLPPTGSETVLVIDDEEAILSLITTQLAQLGYRTDGTSSPLTALEMVRADPMRFDLVITDMAMPSLTGTELAEALLAIRPDLPIILCTGHSEAVSEETAPDLGIRAFAMKPLSKADLAVTVRRVLDEARGGE